MPVTLENVVKALNKIDRAHFKRLTETLNVENVRFTKLHEKCEGVYHLHCEKAYLSVSPLCMCCLRRWSRSRTAAKLLTKADQRMTQAAT
eukprot:5293203-Amphidinium_carterae.2